MDFAYALTGKEHRHRVAPQGYQHPGTNHLNLTFQPWTAGSYFSRQGVTVTGRTTLDHIGDIYLLTLKID